MLQMHLCLDPVLREVAAPVAAIDDAVLDALDQMTRMMDAQNGVGLAAPQVGISRRFCVIRDIKSIPKGGTFEDAPILKMINPIITARSDDVVTKEEGCLSILGPDDLPVYADVVRPARVTVEWTDEKGNRNIREFSGFAARIAQHEIDHLDGVLFIDHISSLKREMIMRKVKKRSKVGERRA